MIPEYVKRDIWFLGLLYFFLELPHTCYTIRNSGWFASVRRTIHEATRDPKEVQR